MISLGVPGVEFLPLLPRAGLRRVCPGDLIGVGSRMCEGTVRGSWRAGMASAPRVWLATGPCKEELTTSWGLHRGGHPGLQTLLGSGGQGFPGEGGVALPLPALP